jgi:hypothetical protein
MISNGQANSALHAVQFTKHPFCFDLLIVLREEKLCTSGEPDHCTENIAFRRPYTRMVF